jgi:hypothetical protein
MTRRSIFLLEMFIIRLRYFVQLDMLFCCYRVLHVVLVPQYNPCGVHPVVVEEPGTVAEGAGH